MRSLFAMSRAVLNYFPHVHSGKHVGRRRTHDSAPTIGPRLLAMPSPKTESTKQSKEFRLHVPKSFIICDLSLGAKCLYLLLRMYANVETGKAWPKPSTLERALGIGRDRRCQYQAELRKAGWITLKQELEHGKLGTLIYTVKVDSWPGVRGES